MFNIILLKPAQLGLGVGDWRGVAKDRQTNPLPYHGDRRT